MEYTDAFVVDIEEMVRDELAYINNACIITTRENIPPKYILMLLRRDGGRNGTTPLYHTKRLFKDQTERF